MRIIDKHNLLNPSLNECIGFSFEAIKGKDATDEEAFIILALSLVILMCIVI